MTHPTKLIVTWRAAIEAAARRADVSLGGNYKDGEELHLRRVNTLKVLSAQFSALHKHYLIELDNFDRATIRGDVERIKHHGEQLVATWDAAADGWGENVNSRNIH